MANCYFNIKWLIVAVTFTATVVLLTHLPQDAMPFQLQEGGLDKLAHALVYGAITFLFIFSLRASLNLLIGSFLLLGILAFAAFDELTQPFVNRTASLADWLANTVGIVTVLLSFVCFKNPKHQAPINGDACTLNPDS